MPSYTTRYKPAYPVSTSPHYPEIGVVLTPPGAPFARYDAQAINGIGVAQPSDGATIATWKNLGSLGAAADLTQGTAGARPFFRLVATSGKINNLSAVEGDGARFMASASFSVINQPITVAIVVRPTDIAGTYVWYSGAIAAECEMYSTAGGVIQIYAGAPTPPGQLLAAATWKTHVVTFTGAASLSRLDGSQVSGLNPGTNGLTGIVLFAENPAAGFKAKGMFAEVLYYADGTTPAAIETYLTAKYGSTPQ